MHQDSYEVLQGSYKLAEDNFNVVNAKYQQGAVSEFDKISAEVQMRSIKPNVISAVNAVTLAKLQLKVLMGITADVDIKTDDNLTNYESMLFANQLKEEDMSLENNTNGEAVRAEYEIARKEREVAENELHAYFVDELLLSISVFV